MTNGAAENAPELDLKQLLYAASLILRAEGDVISESILVNSKACVEFQEHEYNFAELIQYYHLRLDVPDNSYIKIAATLSNTRNTIQRVFNEALQRDDQRITSVRLVPDEESVARWSNSHDLFANAQIDYVANRGDDLWDAGLRVFISHHSSSKEDATQLAELLESRGMSTFVAHLDIEPLSEWEKEMEDRLCTMDVLVALLTKEFKESDWCSQEIGYAVAIRVPIFHVRMGIDPFGFIGRYQAITDGIESVSGCIERDLSNHPRMSETRRNWFERYIEKIEHSGSFSRSNKLASELPNIDILTISQADALADAINSNPQAFGAWGFNSKGEENGNLNVAEHLTRFTNQTYELNTDISSRHDWLVRREPEEDLADLPW